MSDRIDLAGAMVLPSLRFSVRVTVARLPAEMAPLLAARWDFSAGPVDPADVVLELEATDDPVGRAPNPLIEADASWTSADTGTLATNGAAVSLAWRGHLHAQGLLHAPTARGGLESLFRALSVLALARRGVTVLHASCVHRDGRGLVFLGASSAGKTTTARRLGREGIARLSDDMIALELSSRALHPLPFERAGRWPTRAPGLPPPVCIGGALVRKGADAARLGPVDDRLEVWNDARIALSPAIGDEERTLDGFEALARVPVFAFDVPPSGPLAPVITAWLSGNQPERGWTPEAGLTMLPFAVERRMETKQNPHVGPPVERARGVAWRVLDGSAVLVAPSSPNIHKLNDVGTLVWTLADGRELDAIVEAVVNEFEVSRTQATVDVDRFVQDLLAKGLLVVRPPAEGQR
jgi:hypothetical protein